MIFLSNIIILNKKLKSLINDFFEKRPTKDIYEKYLIELMTEKQNIISNKEYDKNLIDKIDKVIESIHIYLSVASKKLLFLIFLYKNTCIYITLSIYCYTIIII